MRKIQLIFLLVLVFIVGCSNQSMSGNKSTISDLDNKSVKEMKAELEQLKQDMLDNKTQIAELKKEIEIARTDNRQANEEILNMAFISDHLIKQLPQVTKKQGYIQQVLRNEGGKSYLMIDFAKMVQNQNDPNGFHIENKSVEKEKISIEEKNILVYKLEGSNLKYSSLEELEKRETFRFYNLFFSDGKLVLIEEQYLP